MAKIPGLMKRGGSYVYRANVPKELHAVYGSQRQIWVTLEAQTESEAKCEAYRTALQFLEVFAAKREELRASTLTPAPMSQEAFNKAKRYSVSTLAKQHASAVLDREEAKGEALFQAYLEDAAGFKRRVYDVRECARLLDNHYSLEQVSQFESWIDFLYDGEAERVVAFIERKRIQGRIELIKRTQAVKDFREFSELAEILAPGIADDQRRPLIRALIEQEISALTRLLEATPSNQHVSASVADEELSAPTETTVTTPALPLLDDVKKPFLEDKKRSGTSVGACEEIYRNIDDFLEIVGDKSINKYTKADVREYLAVIQSVPPNSRKKVAYRDLKLREISKKAQGTKEKGPDVATVHKKFDAVAGFFRWLCRHYDHMPSNPFNDMRPQERKKNVRDERHPFTIDELRRIFSTPPYTGAKSASRWLTPGSVVLKDRGVYWLPLIALYSGLRLGEILQLRKGDIQEEDGVHYIDVNDHDGKSVKTNAGHRRVPIHPRLTEMGLLSYVRQLPELGTRLINDIPLSGRAKDRSGRGSRKMAELLITSGVKTDKNSFHSFRHTFEDACRMAGIDHAVMNILQGHVQGDMSDRYGHGRYSLTKLSEAISKITYPGL
ncbi:site-specific integrase [Rhizobium sp. WL3]|uniref:site-specific integrase n=1 Tax=Rhizobium sp. WL3 TaxID=2603277 RepID=UPI001650B3E0|nr:site-specific integrase [Rhizobium sp. WL3]